MEQHFGVMPLLIFSIKKVFSSYSMIIFYFLMTVNKTPQLTVQSPLSKCRAHRGLTSQIVCPTVVLI